MRAPMMTCPACRGGSECWLCESTGQIERDVPQASDDGGRCRAADLGAPPRWPTATLPERACVGFAQGGRGVTVSDATGMRLIVSADGSVAVAPSGGVAHAIRLTGEQFAILGGWMMTKARELGASAAHFGLSGAAMASGDVEAARDELAEARARRRRALLCVDDDLPGAEVAGGAAPTTSASAAGACASAEGGGAKPSPTPPALPPAPAGSTLLDEYRRGGLPAAVAHTARRLGVESAAVEAAGDTMIQLLAACGADVEGLVPAECHTWVRHGVRGAKPLALVDGSVWGVSRGGNSWSVHVIPTGAHVLRFAERDAAVAVDAARLLAKVAPAFEPDAPTPAGLDGWAPPGIGEVAHACAVFDPWTGQGWGKTSRRVDAPTGPAAEAIAAAHALLRGDL